MALFKWKKDESGAQGAGSGNAAAGGDSGFQPQPDKARKWFEHAKVAADRYDFNYALTCYANGLKLDPEAMHAHESMFEAGIQYMNKGGKPASGKEIRSIADTTAVSKMAAAEFAWMKDYRNLSNALKTLEYAVKAEQYEFGNWIAPKIYSLLRGQKKQTKSTLREAMELFKQVSAWDQAISVGEMLIELEPSNADIASEVKDMAAQRAMDQGGYETAAGQEGGFRKFIKDADKQRELIESEQITTTDTVEERNLERARAAYEADPTTPDVINQYGQLLKKQGTPEAYKKAHEIFTKGYAETKEYRFKMLAGDIRIDEMRRRLRKLNEQLEAMPDDDDDDALRAEQKKLRNELLQLQAKEYAERIERYPTDRHRKFELGEVFYELGRYEDAMPHFQSAKEEPRLRVRAGHLLGRCFARERWHREAIGEFREAIDAIDATERERELDIRYDLMLSLIESARDEKSLDVAREALDICSGIARKNITFRDIRKRRREIDDLIRELSGGDDASSDSSPA